MRNKHFAYINNTKEVQKVIITYVDKKGETHVTYIALNPKEVMTDSTARINMINSKNAIVDVSVSGKDGSVVSLTEPKALGTVDAILKKSVVLDIETSGKLGPDSITQIGIYEPASKKGYAYFPTPNALINPAKGESAYKSIQSELSPLTDLSFKELKYTETLMRIDSSLTPETAAQKVKTADKALLSQIEERLIKEDFFQAEQMVSEESLKKYAGARAIDPSTGEIYADIQNKREFYSAINEGRVNENVIREHFERGTGGKAAFNKIFSGGLEVFQPMSMRNILREELAPKLQNKVTWIANAAFESTQFGGHIDAYAKEAFEALNTDRAAKGLDLIKESTFIKGFGSGRYEEEILQLNLSRHADDQLVTKNPFFGTVESISTMSGKPFFVTGEEFTKARAMAQKTGDWSKLWKTFLETTTEGSVRDILDLPKMQQSMLIKSELMNSSEVPTSFGVEVQARLYGFLEQQRKGKSVEESAYRLFQKELHSGLGDTALSETPILREALDQINALDIVMNKKDGSEDLLKQAMQGEGAYYRAVQYGQLMDFLNQPLRDSSGTVIESLHDVHLKARAGRYALDIAEQGYYETRENAPGLKPVRVTSEVGGLEKQSHNFISPTKATKKTSFGEMLEDIMNLPEYKMARKDVVKQEILSHFKGSYDESTMEIKDLDLFKSKALSYSESAGAQIKSMERHFNAQGFQNDLKASIEKMVVLNKGRKSKAPKINPTLNPLERMGTSSESLKLVDAALDKSPERNIVSSFKESIEQKVSKSFSFKDAIFSKAGKGILGAIALFGASSLTSAGKAPTDQGQSKSLLMPTYEKWLERKQQVDPNFGRYNEIEGMQENGLAALLRKATTDFGSPYRNPGYSMSVLENHKVRRERERYMSAKFAERYFSEKGDIGFFLKSFIDSSFRKELGVSLKQGYSPAGSPLSPMRYPSKHLMNRPELSEHILEGRSVTVEDADTLTIQKGGRDVSIRLAGIDAPETSHGGRSAQPFAEEAKALVSEMLANAKDVRIVTDNTDTTYGRQVGVVYADGKNLNLELIKRGFAAYLPYKGKGKQPIYDQKAFKQAEEMAYKSNRGMWAENYFKAYKELSVASGQTVTFNTLANPEKVAQNSNYMSMLGIMEKAQREGGISSSLKEEIASIGKVINSSDKPFEPDTRNGGWSETDLQTFGGNNNSILTVLDQQKYEIGSLMRTRNSKHQKDQFKASKFNKNNLELTSSTLAKDVYQEEAAINNLAKQKRTMQAQIRLKRMEEMQQLANRNYFNSPIAHHRM